MARILCINPWIFDFAAFNLWIEPLGLLTAAAVLRKAGHDIVLVDCLDRCDPRAPAPAHERDVYGCGHFEKAELVKPEVIAHVPRRWGRYGLPVGVFEAELKAHRRPDAVLVTSMMTYWYPGPFDVIRRVKARWPSVPVALGGVYATLCADHARAHSGADAVLVGPGERAALRWVNRVTGESRPLVGGAEHVLPAHDLRRPQGYVALQTARGCPFHCPYCAVDQLSPGGFLPRAPERVVEEIRWCVESLGVRDIAFYDDALLVDAPRHLSVILDGVLERGLRVRFHSPNGLHARYVDRRLARKMRRAGFTTVRLGLETSDPDGQARDGGKIDESSFVHAVEALLDAGFSAREVAAYVLIGRPGQRVESTRSTVGFAHGLGIQVRTAQYSPIPGTAEWPGGMPGDVDPLLHNNSVYACGSSVGWEEVKGQVREGNRALLAQLG